MFDVLLKELAKRLNLGGKADGSASLSGANALLGMLLSLMFDEKCGGFSGFIDRFRAKGLGDAVTSWFGNGENKSLSTAQLETVLGPQVLAQMASRLDLAPSVVATALGQLIPTVIDKLSPDGRLPSGSIVPDVARAYVGQFSDFANTAVLPEMVAAHAAQHTLEHGPVGTSSSGSKLWLLLIPVLIAPLFFIKQCSHEPNVPVQAAPPTSISVEPAAPTVEPVNEPAIEPAITPDPVTQPATTEEK